MSRLAGHHILVTGASSGLGRSVARRLALDYGATVIATARREDRLKTLQGEASDRIIPVRLDLQDKGAIADFCGTLEKLDGAVLNAGVTAYGPFLDSRAEQDEAIIATNAAANVSLVRGLLPYLEKSQGRLLFVGSVGGLTPLPYQAVYSGSKAFLHAFAFALREEVREQGIHIGVFAPGGIRTEMSDDPAVAKLQNSLADVETVADAAIKAYFSDKALTVSGASNKAMASAIKVLPRSLIGRVVKRIYS